MTTSAERKLRVFLSYRRDDCAVHAGRLAENLRDRAGADVFLDIDDIKLGENFVKRIEREISSCDVVIVMIGDDWLHLTGADGQPRLHDPLDWIHLEVKSALEREVPVVPVLVEGASMPRPQELPEPLQDLAYRNGAKMRDESWTQDFQRLAGALPSRAAEVPTASAGTPARRERAAGSPIDFVAARAFVESIPAGRWSSYKDVAMAGGSPRGAMAVGGWIAARGDQLPHVWRVLNNRGEVAGGWTPANAGMPQTPEEVRERLIAEGVQFDFRGRANAQQRWAVSDAIDSGVAVANPAPGSPRRNSEGDVLIVAGRLAYPEYLSLSAYICQSGRSFRSGIEYLGFYAERNIKPEVARILHKRDDVEFSTENADRLAERGGESDSAIASLIHRLLEPGDAKTAIRREPGATYQVFLLSPPDSDETIRLSKPIFHAGAHAWTQHQRYVTRAALIAEPATTAELSPDGVIGF